MEFCTSSPKPILHSWDLLKVFHNGKHTRVFRIFFSTRRSSPIDSPITTTVVRSTVHGRLATGGTPTKVTRRAIQVWLNNLLQRVEEEEMERILHGDACVIPTGATGRANYRLVCCVLTRMYLLSINNCTLFHFTCSFICICSNIQW